MQNKRAPYARPPRQLPPALIALIDVVLIGVCLVIFALFDHVIPRMGQPVDYSVPSIPAATAEPAAQPETPGDAAEPAATAAPTASVGDFSARFPDKFTSGEVVRTPSSYQSANVNITLSRQEAVFGSYEEVYFVQDIYIRNIECLRTHFAKDRFGRSITEPFMDITARSGAIATINSDFYSFGNKGVVIRNGVLYRDEFEPGEPVLILYRDGNMKVYNGESDLDVAQAMADGAWQSFSFGPNLLDENGAPFESGYARSKHDPRTFIGMIEPGHYLFVVIDGRQSNYSDGMTYKGTAELAQQLGCRVAYNLDGGRTSQMSFMGELVNRPYKNGRSTSDIICITEPNT